MSVAYNSRIVTDGLILLLDAGNTKSYPGLGTSWYDISGNGYNGTLIGASYSNGAMVFDGVDDYVTLGSIAGLNDVVEEETVIAWCYTSNVDAGRRGHFGNRQSGFLTVYGSQLGYESQNDVSSWGNNLYTNNGSIKLNTWQQLGFTFKKDDRVKLYIDGVNVSEKSVTGQQAIGTSAYLIGTESFGGWGDPPYFMGKVSVVKNYNRALSATEMAQNFNAYRGRYGI